MDSPMVRIRVHEDYTGKENFLDPQVTFGAGGTLGEPLLTPATQVSKLRSKTKMISSL